MSVGASIISIITESLYDKPIVVFREYVQNSVDSLSKIEFADQEDAIDIIIQSRGEAPHTGEIATNSFTDIFFLDNGGGIEKDTFVDKMKGIADSSKRKISNIGYKGIGRLSGISYCQRLTFVNILSYKNKEYQIYSIDCKAFRKKKNTQEFLDCDVLTVMDKLGSVYAKFKAVNTFTDNSVRELLESRADYFKTRDTGFLVVMEDISQVLAETVDASTFINELSWLLPVRFQEKLTVHNKYGILFQGLSEEKVTDTIPAKSYPICLYLDGQKNLLERPITVDSLRDYVFVRKFSDAQDKVYAVALYAVNNSKIAINRNNPFSGIKVYIDNMLLCEENELLTMLKNLNLTVSTQNELLQTVQGVGVMLYIVDKVNLSANARRTFIDVTDTEAIDFLKLVSDFIIEFLKTRYALSEYSREVTKHTENRARLEDLRKKAIDALQTLAKNSVQVELALSKAEEVKFDDLHINDKKKIVKKIIMEGIGAKVKEYLELAADFKKDTAYQNFVEWLTTKG